ncbi:octanoyl-[acyl-carrier-protein]:protein N-octanoyltransferase LIPT2, mitochondrial-like [Aegotheles albertisi]
MSRGAVRVLRLGLRPYAEALRVQERCVRAVRGSPAPAPHPGSHPDPGSFPPGESVVLSEPAGPVYAWGLRGAPGQEEAARLRARGAELAAARRGGHITFHGPGQLLAFPVLDLRRRRLPLRRFVAALEALTLRLCRRLGLSAARALPPPCTGVWVRESKVCAIGERGGTGERGGNRTETWHQSLQAVLNALNQTLHGVILCPSDRPTTNATVTRSASTRGGRGGHNDNAYMYILFVMTLFAATVGSLILGYTRSRKVDKRSDPYHVYIKNRVSMI